MDPRLHLFGIRHHGPGSAASLVTALDALDPAVLLIEGQPEADPLIACATLPGMSLPLALLHYQSDNPVNAVFAPFAEYSPEWQALCWARSHERPVRFIDWPASCLLAWETEQSAGDEDSATLESAEPAADKAIPDELVPDDDDALRRQEADLPSTQHPTDPMDDLARLAGYEDGESWWHAMVEHTPSGPEMFEAVENAMTALRDAAEQESFLGDTWQRRDQIREAFMRIALRQALKDTDGEIAVIVGAWHVPALRRKTSQTADRTLIRDLKKVRTETAWVPWSDSRLAAGSGYGAGVKAPGWYRHLWSLRGAAGASSAEDFTARWMARVSGFLRTEKLVASPASTIEAARLALTLAALRNKPLPDLEEMRDATLSALCHGDTAPLDLIESRLLKGEQIGALDPEVPQIPLARDLERWQKKCRLKPDDLLRDIALDLRTEAGLLRSTLLHRLSVIDIPWATLLDGAAGRGTYRETWRLTWSPSVALALVQALPYGATIEQAARNKAIQEARQSHDVGRLAALVQKCLLAGLEDAAEQTITRLQHVAVTSQAISPLMESVTTLVSLLRYGTSRPLPIDPLSALVSLLCVEICTGFVMATTDIDPQGARPISTTMAAFDHALTLFGETHLTELWNQTLAEATRNDRVAPLIGGLALRLLHERQILPVEQVVTCFSRATLPPSRAVSSGQYIDGFLSGGAEIIAQDRALLDALDHWIGVLDEADFMEILPMLRRCFSAFALSSRKRLLTSLEQTPDTEPAQRHSEQGSRQDVLPAEFTDLALPLLHRILGFVS